MMECRRSFSGLSAGTRWVRARKDTTTAACDAGVEKCGMDRLSGRIKCWSPQSYLPGRKCG
jgi:hypothetical protein